MVRIDRQLIIMCKFSRIHKTIAGWSALARKGHVHFHGVTSVSLVSWSLLLVEQVAQERDPGVAGIGGLEGGLEGHGKTVLNKIPIWIT